MKRLAILMIAAFTALLGSAVRGQNLSWSSTQGPYSTAVNAFDTANGALFAGTNAGLFISTNGGNIWTSIPSVPGLVYDIAVKGATIYTGGSGGVTVSSDGGITWAIRDSGFPLLPLVYDLKNVNDTLYTCLGDDGFYFSTDSAKHWQLPSNDARGKAIFAMISTGTSLIFAEGAGILRSTDNGFSWNEPGDTISEQTIHVFAMKDKKIFAGTDDGIFVSTDDGASWSPFGTGMQPYTTITSLAFSSDNKTFFAGAKNASGDIGIYRSNDDGNSWQLINSGLLTLSVNSIFATGSEIFAGSALCISRSDNNGDSWQTMSNGLPKPVVTSLGSIYNIMFAGTTGEYLFSSGDGGNHWIKQINGLTRKNITAILTSGTTVFAGTDASSKNGGVHRSTDNGVTWSQSNSGMPVMSINSLAQTGTTIYTYGDSGFYYSKDLGNSWNRDSSFIPTALYGEYSGLYAGTDSAIRIYTDAAGWQINAFPENLKINAITLSGKYLYAATDSGVYRDSLTVWKLVTGDTLSVQCLNSNESFVAAGTKTGIYLSKDHGSSWQFQQSAGNVNVHSLYANGLAIYAGTDSGVITASIVGYGVNQPTENSLSLQTTNPSADHAIIRYHIDQRNFTSIICNDLLGRNAIRILNDERDPGEYNLDWNTSSVPSGTYILRLISGGKQASAMINVEH